MVSKRVLVAILVAVGIIGIGLVMAAVGASVWFMRSATAVAPEAAVRPAPAVARPTRALTPRVVFSLERSPGGETEDPIRFEPPVLQPDDDGLVGAQTVSLPRSGWECRVYRRADSPDTAAVGCLHTPRRFGPGGPQASTSHAWRCETETVTPPLVLSSMDNAGWVDWYLRVECGSVGSTP